jgi:glycosyl transferase family 1
MRIFQNAGLYRSYVPRLRTLSGGAQGFHALRQVFLEDRFGAAHILLPILRQEESAFFTNGDDEALQRAWAGEMSLPSASSLEDILRSQIEAHRAEVFYNSDPMRYGSDFVRSLPGCVKHSVAWRAAPSPGADFSAYDLIVCNFPSILKQFAAQGCKTAYLSPAHDPVMDGYAANEERPVDVLFTGSYSRHHRQRALLLEAVARLADRRSVVLLLDASRATRLSETLLGRLAPLGRYRRPAAIRNLSGPPVFGRDLYSALSRSKIVLNGAIDMAGSERGNMRCWEALGCGSLMASDAGTYPEGMVDRVSMRVFASPESAVEVIETMLQDEPGRKATAAAGHLMISTLYSKERQWSAFLALCADIS